MKPKIVIENAYTEAIIDEDCGLITFYLVAELLSDSFNLAFTNKLGETDNLYWDFEYKGKSLVLHYNLYLGVSVFPKALKSATPTDNEAVEEISDLVFQKFIDLDWADYIEDDTQKSKGPDARNIIQDLENSNGARITLEKESGKRPFTITFGIYGLMVHTHFEENLENAMEYIAQTKYGIKKIIDLHDMPKDQRDADWHAKFENQLNALAEINKKSIPEETPTATHKLPDAKRSWWQKYFGSE